ncbi:hypothetical protein LWI28_017927 [Acer negundo]|uniref:Endonuclease/exonuclease/phosphatase domain-containing protein n=1 Tax=Acer negundo TaxID=4023 RepID=A0AAD5P624_ACENE|nr:hypothetical protein LWI28_017927 [Acer negundo]
MEMGPDQESQDVKECQVEVSFFSDTPVVGCAVKPNVRVRVEGSFFQPPHSLCCTWYREQVKCSVHHSVLASLQCISCEKLKMPFKKSYHCSPECFVAAWKEHLARHRIMTETINSTAISDHQETKILRSCGSWFDLGSAMVVKGDWVKVGSSETYEPSEDDTGFRLRLESLAVNRSTGTPMSPINIVETNPVITFPPRLPRCMIQLEKFRTICPSSDVTFNVLSYNILADMYASISAEMQSYCPTWALAWDYRRKNLLSEIIEYNADIICLQEVQSDHFEYFFEPELTKLGYSVMFKAKKKGVYTEKGEIFEGCATFYRHLLFKEVIRYELEFANTALPLVDALGPEQKTEACIRLIKDNVAIVVVLEAIENGCSDDGFQTRICVANTHLHANPKHPDVKLCQVSAYASFCNAKGIEEQHSKKMDPNTFEPLFTHHTPRFSGTLDYIFYSADKMRLLGVLELVDREMESVRHGLPSAQWSSDHIALMARFRIEAPSPSLRKSSKTIFPRQPWFQPDSSST